MSSRFQRHWVRGDRAIEQVQALYCSRDVDLCRYIELVHFSNLATLNKAQCTALLNQPEPKNFQFSRRGLWAQYRMQHPGYRNALLDSLSREPNHRAPGAYPILGLLPLIFKNTRSLL